MLYLCVCVVSCVCVCVCVCVIINDICARGRIPGLCLFDQGENARVSRFGSGRLPFSVCHEGGAPPCMLNNKEEEEGGAL